MLLVMVSGRRYYNHLKWRPAVYYSKRFRTQAGLVHYSLVQGHIPQFHPLKKKESIINQIMHTYFEQLSLVHTSYISISHENKAWILLWDFFFVSPFVLLLAYAWTMSLCLCLHCKIQILVLRKKLYTCFKQEIA